MLEDALKRWIAREKSQLVLQNSGLSLFMLIAGLIVLFLTFWLTYAVIYGGSTGVSAASELLFRKRLSLSHEARLVCSAVFTGLLVFQYFRTDPFHWGDYPADDYKTVPGLAYHTGPTGALAMMLIHSGASANMIADILLSGPRLFFGSFKIAAQARRLRQADMDGCARLLAILFQRPAAVPLEELANAGWVPWLQQLRQFDGVRVLTKGVALSSELRTELGEFVMEQPPA